MMKHVTGFLTGRSASGSMIRTNERVISLFFQSGRSFNEKLLLFRNHCSLAEYSKSTIKKKKTLEPKENKNHFEKKSISDESLMIRNEIATLNRSDEDFNVAFNQLDISSTEHHDISTSEDSTGTLQTPPGLYVVATPIGNMHDLSERAKHVLKSSQIIACEDTRTTRKLLHFHSLESNPPQHLISFVENKNATEIYSQSRKHLNVILNKLTSSSQVVSLVSECGSPCISDPGWMLVKSCHEYGVPVYSVPGPSSIVTALMISGFNSNRFIFEGFLPMIPKKRRKLLQEMNQIQGNRCLVFFENPNRIKQTLQDCLEIFGPQRQIALCFELTKLFERVQRGKLSTIARAMMNEDIKGECTIIIAQDEEEKKTLED
ncbi:hypothetical protein C9374_011426 [Naegleria lovaniensis]|uniref:Tetrapyrrole methylase domain-containing protein n=1 Tax=Naegleria lovaniensis TaxID=51637 RepID=A0AA88H2F1_NAELO|nr:uncharacterized protein C9374_011426 [Naegleria lovaniensis]KAG2392701.1 hypothetical protein C9374_011426 [Naegleria lovaniensis]